MVVKVKMSVCVTSTNCNKYYKKIYGLNMRVVTSV